jgi:hypothetical protein
MPYDAGVLSGFPVSLLVALENSLVGRAVREGSWTYPILQTLHITGLTAMVGAAGLFDLRLLGLGRKIPVRDAAAALLPCAWAGFSVVVTTGFLLFTADAMALVANTVFQIKMGLIALSGVNVAAFHRGIFRTVEVWNVQGHAPRAAKVAATVSLLAWLGTITCGRFLAYLD